MSDDENQVHDSTNDPAPAGTPGTPVPNATVNIPGWPQDRFHPVYGKRTFDDPNAFAQAGGDGGDWRFTTAFAADAARTQTEADLAHHYGMRRKVEAIDAEGVVPVSMSVAAHESAAAGNVEPGVVLPQDK